jgi:DNA transformation protein and related proteins
LGYTEGGKPVATDSFVTFVLEQLSDLEGLSCRAMFGGHGLYCGPTFFGILHAGRLYLKTDDSTEAQYVGRGMKPFRPSDKQVLKTYYEVPADVLEDREQLTEWAQLAVGCAAPKLDGRRSRQRR